MLESGLGNEDEKMKFKWRVLKCSEEKFEKCCKAIEHEDYEVFSVHAITAFDSVRLFVIVARKPVEESISYEGEGMRR